MLWSYNIVEKKFDALGDIPAKDAEILQRISKVTFDFSWNEGLPIAYIPMGLLLT